MPIPKPNKNEKQNAYMSRCISFVKGESPNMSNNQATAMCGTAWRTAKGIKTNEWIEGLQLSEGEGYDPKKEIMIFPLGKFKHPQYGELDFSEKFFATVIENYENNILQTQPFIDQEHDEGKALAFFDTIPYYRQGVGLFAKPKWTPYGKEQLAKGMYQYFSPWIDSVTDPQTEKTTDDVFRGGAATNIPFLKMMPPIVDDNEILDDKQARESISIKLNEIYTESQSDSSKDKTGIEQISGKAGSDFNTKEKIMDKELKLSLIKLFKLDEDATDEDVQKAADEAAEKPAEKPEEKTEEKEEEKSEEKSEDDSEKEELKKELNESKQEINKIKCEKHIEKALSEGKIIPKERKFWEDKYMSDPKNTEDILDHMQPVVKLSEKGVMINNEENKMSDSKLMDAANELYEKERDRGNKTITLSDCIVKVNQKNPELGKEHAKKYMANCKFADRF